MEIVVKINKLKDIEIIKNADAFLLSNRHFSYRFDESFCINKIRKVKNFCKQNNKKVYILLNKIFKDHELEKLKEFMIKLIKVDVDGFYFADFAVFMIAKELNVADKCIFYHETFLRNSYDIKTYQSLGINKIVCSKDMNLEDINHLDINQKDNYGILCFGYIPLYESERKVLTHYLSLNKLAKNKLKSFDLSLKEVTRDELYKIIQQEGISSIFDSKVLSYLPYVNSLNKHINTFIIDSLFFDASYINDVVYLFKQASSDEEVVSKLNKLDESIEFSDGFLNKRIGLM